jgi:hypothetical protein
MYVNAVMKGIDWLLFILTVAIPFQWRGERDAPLCLLLLLAECGLSTCPSWAGTLPSSCAQPAAGVRSATGTTTKVKGKKKGGKRAISPLAMISGTCTWPGGALSTDGCVNTTGESGGLQNRRLSSYQGLVKPG